jgi:hypothetical protein
MWVVNYFKNISKLRWTHPLTKLNTNMSLRNLSKFIQLQSTSKLRFSGINTNSDITPPSNLDIVTFEFLLT